MLSAAAGNKLFLMCNAGIDFYSIICIVYDHIDDVKVFNVMVFFGRQTLLSTFVVAQRLVGKQND